MAVAIITGSAGLIGSESCRYFASQGLDIVGIDNDMRAKFFGPEASTLWQRAAQIGACRPLPARRYGHSR